MALSREEVNRLLAEAAEASRGLVHQMSMSTRLSEAQIDELSGVDPHHRRERARELVALEGRAWHREMDEQLLHMSERRQQPPATGQRRISEREMREIAVSLDDLNEPPPH
jgi:hypothetical protein